MIKMTREKKLIIPTPAPLTSYLPVLTPFDNHHFSLLPSLYIYTYKYTFYYFEVFLRWKNKQHKLYSPTLAFYVKIYYVYHSSSVDTDSINS